jgi:hypothetical protein
VTDVVYLCHNCGSVHEVESIRENLILDLRTAASYELSGRRGMLDLRTHFLRWRMSRGLARAIWPGNSRYPWLTSGPRLVQGPSASRSRVHKPFEQYAEVDHGDPHGRVAAAVGKHDAVAVDHRATRVDDVRDVTIAFRLVGDQERLR